MVQIYTVFGQYICMCVCVISIWSLSSLNDVHRTGGGNGGAPLTVPLLVLLG